MTIPEGFAQVTHIFTGAALPNGAAVTFGVEPTVGDSPADVALKAFTAWQAQMLTSQVATVVLSDTLVKFGPDDVGPSASAPSNAPGTGGGTAAPPNVTFLGTKVTDLGGRRGRGRIYVPGVNEANIDANGNLTSPQFIQTDGDMVAWLGALASALIPMVLLHDPATEWVLVNGQPRRVPVAGSVPVPTPVTNLICSSRVATQRRRLRS